MKLLPDMHFNISWIDLPIYQCRFPSDIHELWIRPCKLLIWENIIFKKTRRRNWTIPTYKCGLTCKCMWCVDQISQPLKGSFLPSYKGAIIQVEMLKEELAFICLLLTEVQEEQQEKFFTLCRCQIHWDTQKYMQ